MFEIKLHKRLFSLTLLISLISFSRVVHEQVKPANTITEVVISNSTTTSAYHLSFTAQNIAQKSTTYCSFNFENFIQTQNGLFSQKEKTQNVVVLILKKTLSFSHLNLVSVLNTDDYPFTFIG